MRNILISLLVLLVVSGCGPAILDLAGIDPRTVILTFPKTTEKDIKEYINTIHRREITLNRKFVLFIPDEESSEAFVDTSPFSRALADFYKKEVDSTLGPVRTKEEVDKVVHSGLKINLRKFLISTITRAIRKRGLFLSVTCEEVKGAPTMQPTKSIATMATRGGPC